MNEKVKITKLGIPIRFAATRDEKAVRDVIEDFLLSGELEAHDLAAVDRLMISWPVPKPR